MSNEFARRLNDIFGQIATLVNAIATLPDIQMALANLGTATDAAQQAAANANAAAVAAANANALANSYVSDLTINATDAGTSVTITMSAHIRHYATTPATMVSVNGGAINGVPYGTDMNPAAYIYYDQASRAGGAVTYAYTFDSSQVAQLGNRHSVGMVQLPIAGGTPTDGDPVAPPGGSYRGRVSIE